MHAVVITNLKVWHALAFAILLMTYNKLPMQVICMLDMISIKPIAFTLLMAHSILAFSQSQYIPSRPIMEAQSHTAQLVERLQCIL